MTKIEKKLPILKNGFAKWKNNEIDYRGRQVVQIGDNRFNRLSNKCWKQIKVAQQEYIEQATETFFKKLKNRFDVEPKEYQKATKDTVLWILSNAVVEPTHKILWLPYATFQHQNAFDKTFGTHTPNLTSIRACYLNRQNVDVSWVSPQALECQIINQQTAMLGYVRFLEYLEQPTPPGVGAPVVEGKPNTNRKDPYNAKIKAKFFDMIIEKDATIMGKKTYQNNNEKFKDYANTMRESFGLVVKPGTLENNWNKTLNEPEKKYLRELLITHNYRGLALTVAVTM